MLTGTGDLVRLADGAVLASQLGHMGNGLGPAVLGDVAFVNCSSEGGGYKPCDPAWASKGVRALRLEMITDDRVESEELWRVDASGSLTLAHGLLFVDNQLAIDPHSGEVVAQHKGVRPEHLVTVAGDRMYALRGRVRGRDLDEGQRKIWNMEVCEVGPSGFGGARENPFTYEEGDDATRRRRAEECNMLMWNYFTRNGAFFQGTRMYLRSNEHLYCIGDARRPYRAPAGSAAVDAGADGEREAAGDAAEDAAPPALAGPGPEVLARWQERLLAATAAALARGDEPAFALTGFDGPVAVEAVDGDGLRLAADQVSLTFPLARLSAVDRAALARAICRDDTAADRALAAFFAFAAGERAAAFGFLEGAGEAGAEVATAFGIEGR